MIRREYHWRDSMRLRAGLLWKADRPSYSDYPSLPKCILLLLLVLILWSWAMDRDYAEEKAAEAERAQQGASARTAELARCLNGTQSFTAPNGSGKGYGLTAIVCRKAESFDI